MSAAIFLESSHAFFGVRRKLKKEKISNRFILVTWQWGRSLISSEVARRRRIFQADGKSKRTGTRAYYSPGKYTLL